MTDDNPSAEPGERNTGLPGFRTWRGVYLFVAGCFVAYLALLTVFTIALS